MSQPFRLTLTLLLAVLATGASLQAFSDPPPNNADLAVPVAYGPSDGGAVNAVATDGTRVYYGGGFTRMGLHSGGLGALSASNGLVSRSFAVPNGVVTAAVKDGQGGYYIGGSFTEVNGKSHISLAHLLADGSLDDAFTGKVDANRTPFPTLQVNALALADGILYVGGHIDSANGSSATNLVALSATSGATISAWAPQASGGVVNCLAVSGGTVYLAGSFATVSGQARVNLAAVADAVTRTGWALDWYPDTDGMVQALNVQGNTVFAGGSFTTAGGQTRNHVAAFNDAASNTGWALAWDPNADADVYSLLAQGGKVYLGGAFANLGGSPYVRLAAVDALTGLPQATWTPAPDNNVTRLSYGNGKLYAGGSFSNIGGQSRRNLASIVDAASGTGWAYSWAPQPENSPGFVLADGSRILAGGAVFNVVDRTYLAAVDLASGDLSPFDPEPDFTVTALLWQGGLLYVGGNFNNIGDQHRTRLAALDASGGTGWATTWHPDPDGTVSAMTWNNGILYAAGAFGTLGGQTRPYLGAVTDALSGTGWAYAWNPAPNTNVNALASSGAWVYAGGAFNSIGGQTRNGLAALADASSSTGWASAAWDPNPNSSAVNALAFSGSRLYVGGNFTFLGGQARNYLGAVEDANGSTGWASTWVPSDFPNGFISALALAGDRLYAAGSISACGTYTRFDAARYSLASGQLEAWNPQVGTSSNGNVNSLAVSGPYQIFGGSFDYLNAHLLSNYGVIKDKSLMSTDEPAFKPSPNGATVLGPVPAKVGEPVCLYFDKAPSGTDWDIYNSGVQRVATLHFGAERSQCYQTRKLAPGLYYSFVTVKYPDGSSKSYRQKFVLTP